MNELALYHKKYMISTEVFIRDNIKMSAKESLGYY
jgi:hypothetical protein